MININRNNYEEYFLDFHDGQLSPEDENILFSFLAKNPDLKAEFDLVKMDSLIEENKNIVFSNKTAFKKTSILGELTDDNFDELCIAKIEGDLNNYELLMFEEFVRTISREKDLKLYELTKLSSDTSITFKDKSKIKKQELKVFSLKSNYTIISVAASIIILIALYIFIPGAITEKKEFIVKDMPNIKTKNSLHKEKPEDKNEEVEKTNMIKVINRDIKEESSYQLQELESAQALEKNIMRDYLEMTELIPLEIIVNVENSSEIKGILPMFLETKDLNKMDTNKYMSLKTFLATAFNKSVLNKENKDRIEFFDIAQAGVRGINKLTGSNMKLDRKYDKNGIPDKTEFNSRLIAFSTPIKKD